MKSRKTTKITTWLLLLATLLQTMALALTVSATDVQGADTTAPREWADEDYADLYVKDADGDGKDDRIFFWDAFDLTEKDGAVTALVNQLNPEQSVSVASGTAGDGYVATLDILDFSKFFPKKTVSYQDADVDVLQDSTWEMVLFQNTTKTYTNTSPTNSGSIVELAPLTHFQLQYWTDGGVGTSFVGQTYGAGSSITGKDAVQIAFDTSPTGSWNVRSTTVLGNPRGADHTFTYAVRHDYTVPEGEIEGTLTLDFLRDGVIPVGTPLAKSEKTSYSLAYNALYLGNWKAAATPSAAKNRFTFGALDWAYRAIRIYDVPLTETQLKQNHVADLLSYYRIDLTEIANASALIKNRIFSALASINIGDENAKEAIDAAITNKPYAEYYVQDGLTFLWTGENYKIGESVKTASGFENLIDPSVKLDKMTNGRQDFNYYPHSDAALTVVDGGLLKMGVNLPIFTYLVPTRKVGETDVLADMTLEVSQKYIDTVNISTTSVRKAVRGYDGGAIWLGALRSLSNNKMAQNAVSINGTIYLASTYTDANDTVQTVYRQSNTTSPFYRYMNGMMVPTEVPSDVTLTPALVNSYNNYASNLPVSANGTAGLISWNPPIFASYDNFAKNSAEFLNGRVHQAFTTTMIFDYDESDPTATAFTFDMFLGRDGQLIGTHENNAYDASLDYSSVASGFHNGGAPGDKTGVSDENSYAFTYGVTHDTVYSAIRIYNRALTEKEIAQNNFIDIAMAFETDLTAYGAASAKIKERIHMAFASYSQENFTKESFESALSNLLAMKGLAVIDGMDALLSFDGFAGALYSGTALRAQFTADTALIETLEAMGLSVELGVLIAPTDDPASLTVSYDTEGNPVLSEGTVLRRVYSSNGVSLLSSDGSFAPTVTHPEGDLALELNEQISFRAYAILSEGGDSATVYANAEGPTLGDSVSFNELYRYLAADGYAAVGTVKTYYEEILPIFERVQKELDAVKTADALIENSIAKIGTYSTLHEESMKKAPVAALDPFTARYHATNALTSLDAISYHLDTISTALLSYAEAIDALESAILNGSETAEDLALAATLTAPFKKAVRDSALFVEEFDTLDLDGIYKNCETYFTAYEALFAEVKPKNVTLNGNALKDYAVFADQSTLFAAKTLALEIGALYGITVNVVDTSLLADRIGCSIILQNNADLARNAYAIEIGESSVTLAGEGDNGAYHAVLAFLSELGADKTDITLTAKEGHYADVSEKTYAADSFLKADGTLDTESTGNLNVVFIGGSLTEQVHSTLGKHPWSTGVVNYLAKLFPNKTVNHVNSGVGGTNSEGGAARFCEHVAPHDPDIIFIEYSVNDDMNNFSKERGQYWLENFLYQCAQLEKIPTVIYLHTPPATLPGSEVYNEWYQQVEYKEEWAAHYGISTVNIFDYSYAQYEKQVAESETSVDYITWLDQYYGTLQDEAVGNNGKYGRYDVHGGYELYLGAIIEALEANASEMLKPFRFMTYMHPDRIDLIERTYEFKAHGDELFTYTDGWKVYTKDDATQRPSGDLRIPTDRFAYPFLTSGVHEGAAGESFTFKTTANSMTFYHMSVATAVGGKVVVYVNDKKVAECGMYGSYVQPGISQSMDLGNNANEEVTVRVEVQKKDNSVTNAYIRFTSIWLGYNSDNPTK